MGTNQHLCCLVNNLIDVVYTDRLSVRLLVKLVVKSFTASFRASITALLATHHLKRVLDKQSGEREVELF